MSKVSIGPGTQSAHRKCHTQLGAGPQVSVRHCFDAQAPGAGRLQQTVTFEADPGEFPPSAGLLVSSCEGLELGAEAALSPRVVTGLQVGLVPQPGLEGTAIARGL